MTAWDEWETVQDRTGDSSSLLSVKIPFFFAVASYVNFLFRY